jgi:hyperosmotically inducible protein
MRRLIILLVILIVIGAGVYYLYRSENKPAWLASLFSSSEDATTTVKVKTALGLSKRVSAYGINVDTSGGVVTLTGQVGSEEVKSLAGEIARDTEGVSEVRNEITVDASAPTSAESARVDDLEIRVAILESFARSPELSGKPIEVRVENRLVTLAGTVDTPVQRSGAEQAARAVEGVAGITNNIAVLNPQAPAEPPAAQPSPAGPSVDLARHVKFELFDSGAFDTSTMTVKAEDGTVTLSGTVRSRAEQLLAERIAAGTLGVKTVVNELKVAAAARR